MQKTTTKTISTISFNTQEYLVSRLNSLVKADIIVYWLAIKHFPEEDETKEHFHVLIEPNGKVNLSDLRRELQELDPKRPDKPLGCLPFNVTKDLGDWVLYAEHDEDYLLEKGEARKYHYSQEEILRSDDDIFEHILHSFNKSDYTKGANIIKAICEGADAFELVRNGTIKLSEWYRYRGAYFDIKEVLFAKEEGKTYRGGKKGHEG